MKRVLVFIEGWGCRKGGNREYCRVVVRDSHGEEVIIKFWRNYNRGNKILPTDDDRANAIGVLIEYLRDDYTHGIVIVRDTRTWTLFRKYIRKLHNGEDICWFIWDDEVRETCYRVTSTSDEYRRTKLRHFKIILAGKFQAKREEIFAYLRDALDFIVGVELSSEELALLIKQARS